MPIFLLLLPENAYGYFDPGTGSLLLQLVIAVIGGCVLYFKAVVAKLSAIWTKIGRYLQHSQFLSKINIQTIVAGLIGCYTMLFYASNNSDLTLGQLLANTALLTIFSMIIVGSFTLITRKKIALNLLLIAMLIYYLRLPLTEAGQLIALIGSTMLLIVAVTAFILALTILSIKIQPHHLRRLAVYLAIITTIPAYQSLSAIIAQQKSIAPPPPILNSEFNKKPNVYFIVPDSYSSIDALRATKFVAEQHINNFSQSLTTRGFTIYPSMLSNYQRTREALTSYFSMDIYYQNKSIYQIPENQKLSVIAGNSSVHQIFANNGYQTDIILPNEYLIGDSVCPSCLTESRQSPLMGHLGLFIKILAGIDIVSHGYNWDKSLTDSMLKSLVSSGYFEQLDGNRFSHIHLYFPNHAYGQFVRHGTCDQLAEAQNYQTRVIEANKVILDLVDRITATDESALIIIASDHGPNIFNGCSYIAPLLTPIEVLERQGVLLAIKWDKDYDGRYDRQLKTSANLFRYVFSYLMGHEKLLTDKADDDTFYKYADKVVKVVDDGKIIVGNK